MAFTEMMSLLALLACAAPLTGGLRSQHRRPARRYPRPRPRPTLRPPPTPALRDHHRPADTDTTAPAAATNTTAPAATGGGNLQVIWFAWQPCQALDRPRRELPRRDGRSALRADWPVARPDFRGLRREGRR